MRSVISIVSDFVGAMQIHEAVSVKSKTGFACEKADFRPVRSTRRNRFFPIAKSACIRFCLTYSSPERRAVRRDQASGKRNVAPTMR